MRMGPNTPQQPAVPEFEEHTKLAFHRVRGALADLLITVGADATRPQEMARQLHLNKNLTWKVSRILTEPDPFAAIPHIPGKAGLKILLRAFMKAGATEALVTAVREAMTEFDRAVKIHSGDRETLEIMLGNLNTDGQQQVHEAHRKMSFRGNSATWGVQARTQLCVNFIAPGEKNGWVDIAWISGLMDFRRLRQDVSWAMASARKVLDDGTPIPVDVLDAIDPDFSGHDKPPLLSEFCSKPLPDVRVIRGDDGLIRYELAEGPVGNTAAVSCIIGLYARSFMRRYREENDTIGEHYARLYTPVETLVHDLFVHEDLAYAMSPSVHLYSLLPGGPMYPATGRDRGLLPLAESVHEAAGPAHIVTPELPDYHHMLKAVVDRLGWDPGKFRGFRFVMRYPPIPALAVLRYGLPEDPAKA